MPNANKTIGTQFETDVVKALVHAGIQAVKPRQDEPHDTGDIHIGLDIVVQAKNWKNVTSALREGTAGAQRQAVKARRRFGVAVIKKRGAPITDAFVAMPLHVFAALLISRQSPDE